jgi:hypothetical protein
MVATWDVQVFKLGDQQQYQIIIAMTQWHMVLFLAPALSSHLPMEAAYI